MADDPVFRIPSCLLDLHSASANDIYRSTLEIRIYDAFTGIKTHNGEKSPFTVAYNLCLIALSKINFIGYFSLINVMCRF